MSNEKFKSENYSSLAGMNSKSSPYALTPMEFLYLTNLDFQTVGSLTQRWGSTQYCGQTFPGQVNSLYEFSRLEGPSYVVSSFSGGIFYGATTGVFQGVSFTTMGLTFSGLYTIGDVASGDLAGFTAAQVFEFYQGVPYGSYANARLGDLGITTQTVSASPAVQSDNILSYAVLDDFLFAADGNKFFKFDGVTTYPVGLPMVTKLTTGTPFDGVHGALNNCASLYPSALSGASDFLGFGTSNGLFYYVFASYVNNRGFEGPVWPFTTINAGGSLLGGSFIAARYPIYTPLQYGISSINLYVASGPTNPAGFNLFGLNPQPSFISNTPASGSSFTWFVLGSTLGGQANLLSNFGPYPPTTGYLPLGLTLISKDGTQSSPILGIGLSNYYPRYLETYQNRLFLAGFSNTPSTVLFSDVAEPEGYNPTFNFEVRTNDADVLTCMKAYFTRLYLFKLNSFHVLSGDNPANFYLQEVSAIYGCLNNRSAVVFGDLLAFLDRKGVMLYNGANITHLSQKIQPVFDSMNFAAAMTSAIMVHDKLRNQIIVAIPTNGSSINNQMAVYDYVANAWTTYQGQMPSVMSVVKGYNNTKNVFYGSYSGTINWYGPSFLSDNGSGYTLYLKTRFLHDMGESIQKQFRRLYINADPEGVTYAFPLNFFQDYGSSFVKSTTFLLGAFQNRIDFGISAKSLAFEMSSFGASFPLRVHGFTLEQRMQRRV